MARGEGAAGFLHTAVERLLSGHSKSRAIRSCKSEVAEPSFQQVLGRHDADCVVLDFHHGEAGVVQGAGDVDDGATPCGQAIGQLFVEQVGDDAIGLPFFERFKGSGIRWRQVHEPTGALGDVAQHSGTHLAGV